MTAAASSIAIAIFVPLSFPVFPASLVYKLPVIAVPSAFFLFLISSADTTLPSASYNFVTYAYSLPFVAILSAVCLLSESDYGCVYTFLPSFSAFFNAALPAASTPNAVLLPSRYNVLAAKL